MFDFSIPSILAKVLVLLTAIPIHEYAHAWAADKMGDPTAKWRKRLTLNPLAHMDPIGVMMLLVFGIGFARGVPVNSLNFTDRKKGIIVTSLAGPISNVLLALVCLLAYKLLYIPYALTRIGILGTVVTILSFMVSINLSLAVFNLLPIPPLDGWNVLCQFLPSEIYWKIASHERELLFVVLLLVMTGIFNAPISFLSHFLYVIIDKLTFFADFLRVIIL